MEEIPGRPTYLEVQLDRLSQNLKNIRQHVQPSRVMIVIKANAYGHGVDGVAQALAPEADYIGVAIVEEGVHLREIGIRTPILVMGGTLAEQLPLFLQHDLTLSASSIELLQEAEASAAAAGTRLTVHLKIDTGMERVGVHEYEAEAFIEQSLACQHLDIEGIFTHLANSDIPDLTHAKLQLQRFREVLAVYERRGIPSPRIRHAANSGAILQLPEAHLDMVRAGLMLYGVYPGPDIPRTVDVRPALRWHSCVAHSKITRAGRPVSYGSIWRSDAPTRILTIPCGYADGYFRRMSNQAQVLVQGKKYAQVGRICMDQFMVNAGNDDLKVGTDVILLGQDESGEQVSIEDMARWAGTIEYEVMTNISARVPRVFRSDTEPGSGDLAGVR
jgi:alanine racemase